MSANNVSNTKKEREKKYYGEIDLAIIVKSEMDNDKFQSLMDEGSVKVTLTLETQTHQGNKKYEAEILDVATDWEAI